MLELHSNTYLKDFMKVEVVFEKTTSWFMKRKMFTMIK
jgi:hypothetical protein